MDHYYGAGWYRASPEWLTSALKVPLAGVLLFRHDPLVAHTGRQPALRGGQHPLSPRRPCFFTSFEYPIQTAASFGRTEPLGWTPPMWTWQSMS